MDGGFIAIKMTVHIQSARVVKLATDFYFIGCQSGGLGGRYLVGAVDRNLTAPLGGVVAILAIGAVDAGVGDDRVGAHRDRVVGCGHAGDGVQSKSTRDDNLIAAYRDVIEHDLITG